MPRYLCLQRSLRMKEAHGEKPSPGQMQAMYAKVTEWRERFQKNIVDVGGKLGAGRLATPEPAPDGPFSLFRPGSGVEVIEIHSPA